MYIYIDIYREREMWGAHLGGEDAGDAIPGDSNDANNDKHNHDNNMCIYIHIYIYIYVRTHIYIYIYTYTSTFVLITLL